jgi:hypothetical protein
MRFIATPFLSLVAVWTCVGRAAEPVDGGKPESHWKLFAECRMATVPQKSALALIAEFGEPERVNAAWDHLERMLEAGEATLEADLIVQGGEEKPLVSESVAEMRYATEYEPPQIPQRLSAKAAPEALKAWPLIGTVPTAFEAREARNVGERFEFTARVLEGGEWISVSVEAMHSRFEKWAKFDFAELPGGEKLAISQPQFSQFKNRSSFRLRNGEKILIGVHKLERPEKTFELFVLQVKARQTGEAQ